jgi:hypothetical protein
MEQQGRAADQDLRTWERFQATSLRLDWLLSQDGERRTKPFGLALWTLRAGR